MDQQHPGRSTLIRTLAAGLLVFGLMQTTGATQALSWLARPAVAAIIHVFGGQAVDGGTYLIVGKLRVPWSRDCAGFIAGAAMESLWLPWLLLCPWCFPRRWILGPAALLLAGTVPVFSMHFGWFTLPGIAWAVWLLHHASAGPRPTAEESPVHWAAAVPLLLMMLVPFTASTVGPVLHTAAMPPAGLMARPIGQNAFLMRFPGQSPDLVLTWNAPNGSGRHHTLPVCFRYRGITLNSEPSCAGIETDGKSWYAEAFLIPGGKLVDYDGYLRETLLPFTPAGIHLIASIPQNAMPAAEFDKTVHACFQRVADLEGRRD